MLRPVFSLPFLVIALAACSAAGDAPAPVGDSSPADPAPPGNAAEGAGSAHSSPAAKREDASRAIDFGAEPAGAPALSRLSCPDLSMPAVAATLYVDASASGAEDGTKAAPFRSVAKAFAHAGPSAVIWVAAGTYSEQLRVPDKDIAVLGGFERGFGARTNACATVLQAPNANAPAIAATAGVNSFAIEGVTIQKSVRGLLGLGDSEVHGNVTIARCVFAENGEKRAVGGAVFLDGFHARIFRSVFRDNRGSKGAALAISGDVTLTIDQNVFERNLGYSDHGGGLYVSALHSKISRNTFRGNATGVGIRGGWGGALIVYSNSLAERARADLSFNVFTENVAGIGAAVFVDDGAVVTMSHDLVYRNRAYPENGFLRGAAIYVDGTGLPGGGSTLTAEYLTVVNNAYDDAGAPREASYGGNVYVEGSSKASFTNSIFWHNGDNAFYVVPGGNELVIDNSIGATACTSAGSGGFVAASAAACKIGAGVFLPEAIYFADETADDYHEKSAGGRFSNGTWVNDDVTSPAIDKGDPNVAVGDEPSPNGSRANLGAFAQTDEASKSP